MTVMSQYSKLLDEYEKGYEEQFNTYLQTYV